MIGNDKLAMQRSVTAAGIGLMLGLASGVATASFVVGISVGVAAAVVAFTTQCRNWRPGGR